MIKRSALFVAFTALIVFGILLWDAYDTVVSPMQTDGKIVTFDIPQGGTVSSVASELKEAGILKKPFYLVLLARLNGEARRIKAGEYQFSTALSPQELLSKFVSGAVTRYNFTIIDGWRVSDLLKALAENQQLIQELDNSKDAYTRIASTLNLEYAHLEGLFLPDTYQFRKGDTDVSLLQRAHEALMATLKIEWSQRQENLPLKTPYEALILASIVERETGLAEERARIAGVFTLRLLKKMKLQTDPTVIYGMGEQFDGNIRRKDLRRDTPYNTYTRTGLPPTPISLPGKAAIRATLQPDITGELYFVATGQEGRHHFSKTLEAHNAAVRKYQLNR